MHSLETTPESLDAYADRQQRDAAAARLRALPRRDGMLERMRRIRRTA